MDNSGENDTIVAVATPLARSALGIVRLSGPGSHDYLTRVFHSSRGESEPLQPGRAQFGTLRHPRKKTLIDEVVVTVFCAPRSYTCEDMVELSCHGNPHLMMELLDLFREMGARPAGPGEFTRRAFLNGRIDLMQAEAINDLIQADTSVQLDQARGLLRGKLSLRVKQWRESLADLIALLEAAVDFPEEVGHELDYSTMEESLQELSREIRELRDTFAQGRLLRDGLSLAILGRTNVGKSTLFNNLIGEPRAIVTEVPGTTRDVLIERADVDGIPLHFVDTAGIRENAGRIEREGMARTLKAVSEAQVVLVVLDGSEPLQKEDLRILNDTKSTERLVILNKVDLPQVVKTFDLKKMVEPSPVIRTSLIRRDGPEGRSDVVGVGRIREALGRSVKAAFDNPLEDTLVTSLRQYGILRESRCAIDKACEALASKVHEEFLLEELHTVRKKIEELTGESSPEEMLDRIFSRFCIGK